MHIEFTLYDGSAVALQSDAQNFELAKQRTRADKTGNTVTVWEGFSFHPTLDHALNKLLALKVRSSPATTLEELRKDFEEARQEIIQTWGNHSCKCNHAKGGITGGG